MDMYLKLPLLEFTNRDVLRAWLIENPNTSSGIWVRVYKITANQSSVSFEELLDQGLCFGWSESQRHKNDSISYYQKFTPRRTIGTTSRRNIEHAKQLIANGEMTHTGLKALGLE